MTPRLQRHPVSLHATVVLVAGALALATLNAAAPVHDTRGAPDARFRLGGLGAELHHSSKRPTRLSNQRVAADLNLTSSPSLDIAPLLTPDAWIEIPGESLQRSSIQATPMHAPVLWDDAWMVGGDPDTMHTQADRTNIGPALRFNNDLIRRASAAFTAVDIDPSALFDRDALDRPVGFSQSDAAAGAVYAAPRQGFRTGTLRAGGGIALDRETAITPSHGHTGPSGSFAVYDLGVRLMGTTFGKDTTSTFDIDVIGGLQAVHASVRAHRAGSVSGGARDADGYVAIPVVGTRVAWSPSTWFQLSGRASTQAIDAAGSIIDIEALATLTLTESIDLEAGYQDIRGTFDVRGVNARLDESGVFARISIQF